MKKLILAMAACIAVAGCDPTDNQNDDHSLPTSKTNGAFVVTVGVENGYAGACPGALQDVKTMNSLLRPYAKKIYSFTDKTATRQAIKAALTEGAKQQLFIFFYSGHGGSKMASYLDTTEEDRMDEYLCLYDGPFLDNDIWAIINRSKGRVVMIVDACHSETMYRAPFTMLKMSMKATHNVEGTLNMIVMSGCPDSDYSYGDINGGMLTNTIKKHFKSTLTYDQLWALVEADKSLKQYEKVQRTKMGADFGAIEAFR